MRRRWLAGTAATVLLSAALAAGAQPGGPGMVEIEFRFERLGRIAGNQAAVWIEDAQGRYVATVFATRFTASGGFRRRPEALRGWVEASGWQEAGQAEVDAVSRPTPRSGVVRVSWNCTDREGRPVPPGLYTYRVEGTIYWQARVLWSGTIRVGAGPAESTAQPAWEPAGAARDGGLISAVSARYRED